MILQHDTRLAFADSFEQPAQTVPEGSNVVNHFELSSPSNWAIRRVRYNVTSSLGNEVSI